MFSNKDDMTVGGIAKALLSLFHQDVNTHRYSLIKDKNNLFGYYMINNVARVPKDMMSFEESMQKMAEYISLAAKKQRADHALIEEFLSSCELHICTGSLAELITLSGVMADEIENMCRCINTILSATSPKKRVSLRMEISYEIYSADGLFSTQTNSLPTV